MNEEEEDRAMWVQHPQTQKHVRRLHELAKIALTGALIAARESTDPVVMARVIAYDNLMKNIKELEK